MVGLESLIYFSAFLDFWSFFDSLLAMAWIEDFESISSTAFVNFSECCVSWFSAVCMALIFLSNAFLEVPAGE